MNIGIYMFPLRNCESNETRRWSRTEAVEILETNITIKHVEIHKWFEGI